MSVSAARVSYVISDLHLGGTHPDPEKPGDRGFRIFSHSGELVGFIEALTGLPADGPRVELVINGDFVDFLAEREADPNRWSALRTDPDAAVATFREIARREAPIFAAIGRFLAEGHRFTLILGNHDLELSYPAVRRALEAALAFDGRQDFRFLHDGEAYTIGDVIIEHGNRYDPYNTNDNEGLRKARSFQSRRMAVPAKHRIEVSPGSKLVATVINPLKETYPFINLLKPEDEACLPILLALEPKSRTKLLLAARAAAAMVSSRGHGMAAPLEPAYGKDIASGRGGDILQQAIARQLGDEGSRVLLDAVGESGPSVGKDIAGGFATSVRAKLGLMGLFKHGPPELLRKRMRGLLWALRAMQGDERFDPTWEPEGPNLDAAREFITLGFRAVLFGHTHLPREVPLPGGGVYLNTGSWADSIRFPEGIISGPEDVAVDRLHDFVGSLSSGDYEGLLSFRPTFARLVTGPGGELLSWKLGEFRGSGDL